MSSGAVVLLATALCLPLSSQPSLPDGKPNFSGKWELQTKDGKPATGSAHIIEQNEKEIRIRDAAAESRYDLKCGTKGTECKARLDGVEAQVTLWYNGPTLVTMAKHGDTVKEIRRTLSTDGQKLTVEILPVVPTGGSSEKLVLVRAGESEQRASAANPAP
jgi:hypothetical protein